MSWAQGGAQGAPTPCPPRETGARGDQRVSWPPPGDPGMGACGVGGVQVWAGSPQLTPKGWRQQATERVMNNLLAVWIQGGGAQVGQLNYPSHNARRHVEYVNVEYVRLGALTVMLG